MTRRPKPDLAALEERIGRRFSDRALLELALTHVSSVSAKNPRILSYQRLEFLGDRVLGLAVSEMLYATYPKAEEGELSQRLADLVRKEACAEVALEWGVGDHLRLGAGEAQTGGARKTALLGDVCESVIGAAFLDGGYETARDLVHRHWRERMMKPRRPLRDAKTQLQEWAQAKGLDAPVYREVDRSGPAHAPKFVVAVDVQTYAPADGEGANKRIAEQNAAKAFLAREGVARAADKKEPAQA